MSKGKTKKIIEEKTMNEDERRDYSRKDNVQGLETRIQQKRQCTREREKDFVKFYKARNSFCLYSFDCLTLRGRTDKDSKKDNAQRRETRIQQKGQCTRVIEKKIVEKTMYKGKREPSCNKRLQKKRQKMRMRDENIVEKTMNEDQ